MFKSLKALIVSMCLIFGVTVVAQAAENKSTGSSGAYVKYTESRISKGDVSGRISASHGWYQLAGGYYNGVTFNKISNKKTNKYEGYGKVFAGFRYTRWVQIGGGRTPTNAWKFPVDKTTKRVPAGKSITGISLGGSTNPKQGERPTALRTIGSVCNDRPRFPDSCKSDTFTHYFK